MIFPGSLSLADSLEPKLAFSVYLSKLKTEFNETFGKERQLWNE